MRIFYPLVSIVVPTKNSSPTLDACLQSVKDQTYQNIEIILVDNNSTDITKEIAHKYTDKVYNKGPERSAQVNYGVEQASGEYVYKIDSDFVLDKDVVEQCVNEIQKGLDAIVVHNSPDVRVSWIAKIRKFEVDMYKYDITHSSARFVKKDVYKAIGGFNEKITAGEDYDLQNKLNRQGYKTGFIDAEALHLGEPTHILPHMMKYYMYGKDFVNYKSENEKESKEQLSFGRSVYLKNWKKFLRHPFLGIAFIIYNFFKFGFGSVGYFTMSQCFLYFSKPNARLLKSDYLDKKFVNIAEEVPYVSFILPTYNAEKYLDRCLTSVFALGYPNDKFEVIVGDGMSSDSTREIVSKYPVVLIDNPRRDAESAKYLCIQKAKGEIYVLLDADNIIASKDWLTKLVYPLVTNDEVFAVESNYLIASDFTTINTYANLLVIVDPLARMLASKPISTKKHDGYLIKRFAKNASPVAGANGFLWRASYVKEHLTRELEKFEETNMLNFAARQQEIQIANVPEVGIYHYYCESLSDYINKRRKIASKFLQRVTQKKDTWVSSRGVLIFVISVLYLSSIILPLFESVYRIIKSRKIAWLWHTFISVVTVFIYTTSAVSKYVTHERR
jgi:glycosyltransferase involved in cell wall biosynthesis